MRPYAAAMDRRGIWLTLLGVAAFAAVVALVPPLREGVASVLSGDAGRLRSELLDLGAGGALVLAGLMLVHAIIPFPSELLNAAAGFVYGFWLALPLVLAGWLLSALATYAIGRGAGRPLLLRLVGEERLEEGARLIERGGRTGAARRAADPDRALQPRRLRRPAPRRCRCGASRGPRSSARSRCAPRSSTSAAGSTRCRPPTPACSSRSASFLALLIGGRVLAGRVRRRHAPLRRRVGSAACCAASCSSPPRSSSSTRCSSRRSSRCCRSSSRSSTSARPAPGSSRPPTRPGRCSARCPAAGSRRGWACARPSSSASRCSSRLDHVRVRQQHRRARHRALRPGARLGGVVGGRARLADRRRAARAPRRADRLGDGRRDRRRAARPGARRRRGGARHRGRLHGGRRRGRRPARVGAAHAGDPAAAAARRCARCSPACATRGSRPGCGS